MEISTRTLKLGTRGTGAKAHIAMGAATYCSGRGGANLWNVKNIDATNKSNLTAAIEAGYPESALCKACFGIK